MFSFNRMINLIKREIVMQGKGIFWGLFGIIVGLITIYSDRSSTNILIFTYICSILFLGFTSFIAYKKPSLRAESILLPATIQEKYFANFIYEFIIVPITIFITACIGAIVGRVISFWLYGNEIDLIDIRSEEHTSELQSPDHLV